MELSGGVVGAMRANRAGTEDRLSALPDDILLVILRRVGSSAAGQTSVLSRRWRRVWALLPELHFLSSPQHDRIGNALEAHGGVLRALSIAAQNASPESVAAWLTVVERRLSGCLVLRNLVPWGNLLTLREDDWRVQKNAIELPCFQDATAVCLNLGFLRLTVRPAGVFARLTELFLKSIWFQGPCELGDAISSPRCPCLQKLTLGFIRGLSKLDINSESLLRVDLIYLTDMQELTILAPALKSSTVVHCLNGTPSQDQPVGRIFAPQLESLEWAGCYDPCLVHLGEMQHIRHLSVHFCVYAPQNFIIDNACSGLLQRFRIIENLDLTLHYYLATTIYDPQNHMSDMTMLPATTTLHLHIKANGHAFGASLFHVLRICSGITRLILSFIVNKMQVFCPSGCICGQQVHWKTEKLVLNSLQEVEISALGDSELEATFVKQLYNWATVLKMLKITFVHSVTEGKAKVFCQMLDIFPRPETCTKFCLHNGMEVLYVPQE